MTRGILIAGFLLATLLSAQTAAPPPRYDLLIQGGTVIDPKNNLNGPADVAIAGGRIVQVGPGMKAADARRVVDAAGAYVVPGLIDMHVHVYAGTGDRVIAGDRSVYPDTFSFRTGVTTMVDAGTSGWRNFPDFKQRVIDRAQTRVLALLNIVGGGMGLSSEHDPKDMDAEATARMAKAHPQIVVGFKTAHYRGPGWPAVDGAVKAGTLTGLPVMVDFGEIKGSERNLAILLGEKLRQGDIYTHCYSGHRAEVVDGVVNPAMIAGRKRGILFDVGHGGASFYWNIAVPAVQKGFLPDAISTDLHTGSMNAGMKDMTNVMSKMLAIGVPFAEVIRLSTWSPANIIHRPELGHLTAGAEADVTVLRIDKGRFGYIDSAGARLDSNQRIVGEVTIRKGNVVWDLNGRAAPAWKTYAYPKSLMD